MRDKFEPGQHYSDFVLTPKTVQLSGELWEQNHFPEFRGDRFTFAILTPRTSPSNSRLALGNASRRSGIGSLPHFKKFKVRVTAMSVWCSGRAPQQTGLEITPRERLEFCASVVLAWEGNSTLSHRPGWGRMVTNEPLHVTENVRKWQYCRFLVENNYLKSVTVKYEKWA